MSLVVTIGCPGAGKSTWAATLGSTRLRMERDRFRECMFGTRRAYHESVFDRFDRSRAITQAMLAAMVNWPIPSWALTDTGLDWSAVAPFVSFAERMQHPVQLVIFDRPWELLAERNETRSEDHRVPIGILQERYETFCDSEAWWRTSNHEKVFL